MAFLPFFGADRLGATERTGTPIPNFGQSISNHSAI